ncbi:hypothetical protein Sjap_021286 [Stephania japonica]|uniref:Uncharacterized protein n=1 Tax=Stephania japonica TaxID=461633 RepID=A0AAP0HRD4_9MAGN
MDEEDDVGGGEDDKKPILLPFLCEKWLVMGKAQSNYEEGSVKLVNALKWCEKSFLPLMFV